jgi:hypothetical protein
LERTAQPPTSNPSAEAIDGYKRYVDLMREANNKLRKEVNDLCAVVDYLEFRLNAEIRRGASV